MSIFHTYERGESRIIVPIACGAAEAVECVLVNSDTGGFTRTKCVGAWRGERIPCYAYDVAGLSFADLRLCAEIVLAYGETDVYVRLPDGRSAWFNAGELEQITLATIHRPAPPTQREAHTLSINRITRNS